MAILTLIRVVDDPVRDRTISLAENTLKEETPTGGKKRDKRLPEKTIKKVIEQAEHEIGRHVHLEVKRSRGYRNELEQRFGQICSLPTNTVLEIGKKENKEVLDKVTDDRHVQVRA